MRKNYSDEEISQAFRHFRGRNVVVKYGGAAMQSSALKHLACKDIVALRAARANVLVVHGGGPELSSMQERLGIETRFVNGVRYTDAETMEAAIMTLCGKVNKELVRLIENNGGRAVGISGIDGSIIKCRRQTDPDLGYVGEIIKIKKELLHTLMLDDIIPVISSVGIGEDGLPYNINADTAAARLAIAFTADYFITLTDVPGVLRNVSDPESLIREVQTDEVEGLISKGLITGGMVPKVRGLTDAVEHGVKTATIANGRIPHALMLALMGRAAVEKGQPEQEEGLSGTTIFGGE